MATELLGDYERALVLLNAGVLANPTDPLLINNLAYCLIETGQQLKAAELLRSVRPSDLSPEQQIAHKATRGMLYFRADELTTGRGFYLEAAEQARSLNDPEHTATALMHLAYEEFRAGTVDVEAHLIAGMELASKSEKPYVRAIVLRLMDRMDELRSKRQTIASDAPKAGSSEEGINVLQQR